MRLEVWNDAIELFDRTHKIVTSIERIDLRLKSQILDSSQSISSNIAEGYCRRSLNEYLQFLSVALGSLGEAMTRMVGLLKAGQLRAEQFEEFDELHYAVENKLVALVKSLQAKRKTGTWQDEFKEGEGSYST